MSKQTKVTSTIQLAKPNMALAGGQPLPLVDNSTTQNSNAVIRETKFAETVDSRVYFHFNPSFTFISCNIFLLNYASCDKLSYQWGHHRFPRSLECRGRPPPRV